MDAHARGKVIDKLKRDYDRWQQARSEAVKAIGAPDTDELIAYWNGNRYGRRILGHGNRRKDD